MNTRAVFCSILLPAFPLLIATWITAAEPSVSQSPGGRDWNRRLERGHSHLAAHEYDAARAAYRELANDTAAPPEVRGIALLAVGHAFWREKAYDGAAEAFEDVLKHADLLPHHRREAEARRDEMRRLAKGLPARDPAASRMKLPPLPTPGRTYYVAPDGDDANPGTEDRPVATLKAARDAIRKLKGGAGLPKGGVCVLVRGGTYPVRETFSLEARDSGTAEAPIVYRAASRERNGTPIFTGGVELRDFAPVTDPEILKRLPEDARGKVLACDLNRLGIADLPPMGRRGYTNNRPGAAPWIDLYVDGRPQQLARWPNEGFVKMGTVRQEAIGASRDAQASGIFDYTDARHERWAQSEDVWLFGYWAYLWAIDSRKVKRIDTKNGRIEIEPCSGYGYREGYPYFAMNLLEELDAPGEWYLERKTNVLYFLPAGNLTKADVQMPVLATPFLAADGVEHVMFRGLTFDMGCGLGAKVTDCENFVLAGCTFRRLGTWAVEIEGGRACGALGCDMITLGGGGVWVNGGDKGKLIPSGHFVENCLVRDFTRVDRAYAPAAYLDGVGVRISHNLFHDSPHHAIRSEGYDHTIEFNEVHSVVYESDDQAGIDMWGNPAYRGHVIRYNFWHHIGSGRNVAGQSGIRLDDMISAVEIYGNVFQRCAGGHFGGVQIHGGKDNICDNNLFIDCRQAFSFSPWGRNRWLRMLDSPATKTRVAAGGVDVTRPPHTVRYPDLAGMQENVDRNFIWRNAAVDCDRFAIRNSGVNELLDNHEFDSDVGFTDGARRDFTLPADSPLYDRFGFRPIPFAEIGLYNDETRASWPVRHEITRRYVKE